MTDVVLLAREGPVVRLTLNRPEKLNALSAPMVNGLRGHLAQIASDASVRAVILEGAGKAFMAGGDVANFHANLPEMPRLIREWAGEFHKVIHDLRHLPKPVIAKVHGAVAGGGLSVMLACDLAIAAENAKFTLAYANIGTSPDGGSTHALPRIVGLRRALELAFITDPFDAKRAADLGLVNWVVPDAELDARALAIAERLAQGPTAAYAQTKALLNASFERPMAEQLAREVDGFSASTSTHDFAEGVTAFVEKRKPRFEGR
ncbi:enoyl-CoA hydratase [Betaproteobacteria bacterium GR16-43]|nr:enoyl-CoA hydratase [Betaproteobacteria bacterium GR16-43]